ncbi:MAG: DAK2 domain-containing protein, partial [Anaerolineae bacterium]|nr:DAK2 domain-containing protein [Anaerolineae bacterium]
MIKSHRVMYIDGHELRRLFMGGVDWLSRHVDTINNLNVFPVPDGDTGTNMLLTVKKAQSFIENLGDDHIGRLSESLATGARYGARGNSGTILSMLLRGFSQGLASCEVMDAQALAIACQHAVEYAYDTVRSVMTPQEGTILTVARATAEAVVSAVESESNLVRLLDRMVQAATVSLQETPELLPVLKDAGVVDSGGAGLLALLEGFQRVV